MTGVRRGIVIGLFVAIAAIILLLVLTADLILATAPAWLQAVALAALLTYAGAIWSIFTLLDHHFDAAARLEAMIRGLVGRRDGRVPPPAGQSDEIASLQQAVHLLSAARQDMEPDRRLETVLACVGEAVVVVTPSGMVSLANKAATARFGGRLGVGHSLFDLIDRERWIELTQRLKERAGAVDAALRINTGETIEARLRDFGAHGGTVMVFAGLQSADGGVDLALHLHDEPPPLLAVSPDTRLAELPATVLDSETTGLDVAKDRLLSLAAVRAHGTRFFAHCAIDVLANPGAPIPPASTRIHGITDAMVAGAATPGEAVKALGQFAAGTVLIGHNIGFDLAILRAEAERAGFPWSPPIALDTLQLAAALDPKQTDLNLEAVARRLGVDVMGRHTALGDALVTADVYTRQVARLIQRGHDTLAKAQAFAATAKTVRAKQKQAGW